ncbi:DUF4838 domain-containing protein [Foetidibacter luteolus]|uniref:DUF4838 domain-containing protein n=1 Tax=Foetidibacter luteolus TaxID=2608880 RepID=UPI001A97ECF7|nr:DUF4838 domain-containing protein [Foetidibacter luteolus]
MPLLLIYSAHSDAQQSLVLSNSGKTNYSIFVTAGNEQETNAAEILQSYLQKICGTKFEITSQKADRQILVLSLENARKIFSDAPSTLGLDGVYMRVYKNELLLAGGGGTGVQNVVYEFLEKFLGCRYFASDAVLLPRREKLSIPFSLNYTYTPRIKYRYINYSEAFKGSYAAWNKLANISGNPNTVKMPGWGLPVHSLFKLVPPEKYYANHPEYFALRDGKRVKTQLDLTNPEVVEIATSTLADIIKLHADDTYFSVSQMDNDGFCQCENCERLVKEQNSQSGPIIDFVNKVAAQFPDKTIVTLAYNYSRKAPATLKAIKNVAVYFCATGVNRAISFEQDRSPGSVYSDLKEWKQKTDNIFFWDYVINFQHLYMPFPNLGILQPNIQFLSRNNVSYTFQQGWAFSEGEFSELRCYIIAKLLWNPDINVSEAIKEFTDYFYGAGGVYVNNYINALNKSVRENKGVTLFNNDAPLDHVNDFLSPKQISIYQRQFSLASDALKKAALVYRKRIMNAAQALRYAILEVKGKTDRGNTAYYMQLLDTFKNVAAEENATLINEGTMNFNEYYTEQSVYLRQKFVNSLALNATAIITKPQGYIPKNSLAVLFDGMLASKATDKKWVAFEQPYVELIIDLKKEINFSSIKINFLHDPSFQSLLPETITFDISDDNKHFNNIGVAKNIYQGLGVKKEVKPFTFNAVNALKARYIKVAIKMIGKSNYSNTNRQPAMRCDEIIIN